MTLLTHAVAKIGFLSTNVSVDETSGFSTLLVAVIGNISLGKEVIISFSTADISAKGDGKQLLY